MIYGLMYSVTDDLFSQVLYSITCALVIACSFDGAGQYSKYLTADQIEQGTKVSPQKTPPPPPRTHPHTEHPQTVSSRLTAHTPKHFHTEEDPDFTIKHY